MPELPEIETLVFELKSALKNREIEKAEILNSSILKTPQEELEARLPGQRVLRVGRIGKYIQIALTQDLLLWFHLGMTGQLLFEDSQSSLDPHTHFILSFTNAKERLFYRDARRFGKIALSPSNKNHYPTGVQRLGREPKEWDRKSFASLLKDRRARIKSLLLDQRLISGLGNIYADESLHRAGIHPLKRAYRIPRQRLFRLHEAICQTLEDAIRLGGSTIDDYLHLDGSRGRFQYFHRVYGRKGESCRTCGTPIRKVKLSGRSSSFCPRCQT